ncbi:uncharacterized protein LOC123013990 [Tribolium madens]|uniref:uncharacterized protein LOC123013990 n=1 Tax=Tribolium madens TaxID=41895 RepID=UPI001CF742E5|nr:uncharacterized protein LOC123013990 [Tribolium madens]
MSEDYFWLVLKCYNLSGLRKSSNGFLRVLSVYILYPIMLIIFGMTIYNIRYRHSNIFEITEVFISICYFLHMVLRKTLLMKNSSLYEEILEQQFHYWNYGLFGESTETKLRKNMEICVSILKFLLMNASISVGLHSISPFFVKSLQLPQSCWIPENNPIARDVIYLFLVILYVECINYVVVFDGFYLLIATNIRTQFVLLQKAADSIKLKSGEEEIIWAKLKKYSQYHSFILSVHKKLNKIYSEFFLCNYILTILGTCIPLFIIFDRSSNIAEILESIIVAFIINVLLVMVFIPASNIEIEAEKLVFHIYNINWYETRNLKIRKFILFWLMQAQVPVQLTGGGMLTINRTLMLQIQRIGVSFSTLLTGLAP